MDMFKELLRKKYQEQGGKKDESPKMKAMADMAKAMSEHLGKGIADDIKGGIEAKIVAKSPEGMKAGAQKVEELAESLSPEQKHMGNGVFSAKDEIEDEMEGEDYDFAEESEEDKKEFQDASEEEIRQLEKKLEELKAKKASK